ncbi:MAG TPA: alpha/beta hydrolase [Phototrophicaceae bacterium]|nr:alpha/beta hydrolase [Phototrophicaceae bacterium]
MLIKVLLALVSLVAATVAGYVARNRYYFKWDGLRVKWAGFKEKQFRVNERTILNYGEGPNNGPALLLIHAQTSDWINYARVLPAISKHYHIYVVDCHGHGQSSQNPQAYSATAMGTDLVQFIKQVIQEPAVVSGHSSGGLLTVWLAANAPEQVRGIVLEDPPLFSSEFPRIQQTFNYVDLDINCHRFLNQTEETDFPAFLFKNSYWLLFFKEARHKIIRYALAYRRRHPQQPLWIFFMPPVMNEMVRPIETYDPHFGDTFYDGSWHKNFDHGEACSRITCPSVLIHAIWLYDENGILLGAMDGTEAERARSLIKDTTFIKVKSGHGFHFEKPRQFIRIMVDFRRQIADQSVPSATAPRQSSAAVVR